MNFGVLTLTCHIFEAPLGMDHTLRNWRALRYGKDDSRGLSCGSTLNVPQVVLKSGNLLRKQGFADSQFGTTVSRPAEEERVRKHTLLSTLVMPRPQRKPPFTIEAAMNKLLGRSKKKENTTAANISETASSKKTETNGRKLKASPSPKKPVNEGAFCPFFVRWGLL